MIKKGATYWNWGLREACGGGNKDLVELMIEKGANWCDYCSKPVAEHLI